MKSPNIRHLALFLALTGLAAPVTDLLAQAPKAASGSATAAQSQAFDALCTKLQQESAGTTEEDVRKLIDLANQLGRPSAANVALKAYLGRNQRASAPILLMAADNAARAGDFRVAVARYKAYLQQVQPTPESSDVYARLCAISLDLLGEADDCYDTVARFGDRFRLTPAAKKYDTWYMAEARKKNDYAAVANRLAVVFAEKAPLEQERFYFWDDLDWLLTSLSRYNPKQADALLGLKKVVPLIRDNKQRSLRAGLVAAQLDFRTASAGKEPAQLAKMHEAVAELAQAYIAAFPTAEVLIEATTLGINSEGAVAPEQLERHRAIFVAGFDKLPDAQKTMVIPLVAETGNPGWYAKPDQWSALALKSPAAFAASPSTRDLIFSLAGTDPTLFTKQEAFLKSVPSVNAAVNNTLAQGPDLAGKGMAHLFNNESWHLATFGAPYVFLSGPVWSTYQTMPAAKEAGFNAQEYWGKMLAANGDLIAKTPVALFERSAVRDYAVAVFRYSGTNPDDKTKVGPLLRQFDWVPMGEKDRRETFAPAYEEYRKWADGVRSRISAARKSTDQVKGRIASQKTQLAEAQKKKLSPAEVKSLTDAIKKAEVELPAQLESLKALETVAGELAGIESQIRAAMDFKVTDITKAPTPLTKSLAQSVEAINTKNREAFMKSGREAYELIKDYSTKKTPFGAATVDYLLTARAGQGFDIFDFQVELLADQLGRIDMAGSVRDAQRYVASVTSGRTLGQYQRHARDQSVSVSSAIGKAIIEQAKKNQFSPLLFSWFINGRSGRDWSERGTGNDVMALLIDKKLMLNSSYRINNFSNVATMQWLVINQFPGIAEKYPPSTYFDAMFLEETARTKAPDWQFLGYGTDAQKKVIDVITAGYLTDWTTLPLGYDSRPANNRAMLANWYARSAQATPAIRDAMLEKVQSVYGKTRFDEMADGRIALLYPKFDLAKPDGREAFFEAVGEITDKMALQPARSTPLNFTQYAQASDRKLSDKELATVIAYITKSGVAVWPQHLRYEVLALEVAGALRERGRQNELLSLAPWFWKVAKDTRDTNYQRALVAFTRDLSDKDMHELAVAFSTIGMEVLGSDMPQDSRAALTSVRSRSMAFAGGTVAVARSDPRYAVYAAQADFLGGRPGPAWDTYLTNPQMALANLKDLDPSFSIWLINQNIEVRNYDMADQLAKQMLLNIEASPTGFDPEARAGGLLAYANLAFARQEYPRARAQFERIVAAAEFANTQARREAEIRIAETDRVTRQFDRAIERLTRLLRRQDRYLQIEGNYEMALVKYDQEDYAEALEYLDRVFSLSPAHVNGRILEGRLQLKTNKLVEATQIKVGLSADQRNIVPGRMLKVDLEDRNLSVVGSAGNLEVRAWTDTGDEETFPLLPFGDSKTKFSGQIPTKLGTATKNDRTLQLLGNSTVYYELFTKGQEKRPGSIENALSVKVASDADLAASSGRILSKEEIEERELERKLRATPGLNLGPADANAQVEQSLSVERAEDEIRPGNPIFVRVVNPSQSIDPKGSVLPVRVTTSSGDVIDAFELKETDPFSGVYEGQIPTAGGQATATASDSDEGSEPNFAISPGDHPAWVGQPNSRKPKAFSIDLNDNVALGQMSVTADVPGRKIKDFVVQVSPNGRQFTTVGGWPTQPALWDGAPKVDLVALSSDQPLRSYDDFDRYMNLGYLNKGLQMASMPLTGATFAGSFAANINPLSNATGLAQNRPYVARYSAAFYMAKPGVKSFEVVPVSNNPGARYIVAIDGYASGDLNKDGHKVSKSLATGVHKLEIFVVSVRNTPGFSFGLQSDIPEAPYMAPTPMSMFDSSKEPRVKQAVLPGVATVTPTQDNGKFDIAFAGAPQGRVVRLLINDFETDAPAIRKVTLNRAPKEGQTQGDQVLPTKQDFMTLRRDQVAQIAPGDAVTIAYNNPSPLRTDRKTQQARLTATFNDANITACLVEYTISNSTGERVPEYVPLRRFRVDEPINIFVWDPDADASDSPDKIKLQARAGDGSPIELTALETANHSGVFLAKVFPVAGAPQRAGELQIKDGQEIVISYFDRENTNPGIPWMREFVVEQAQALPAQIRVYEVASSLLPTDKLPDAIPLSSVDGRPSSEMIQPTRTMSLTRPALPATEQAVPKAMVEGPLLVEVLAPGIAVSYRSKATLYLQTESGRKKFSGEMAQPFDLNVPGTIRREATPGHYISNPVVAGYTGIRVQGVSSPEVALDEGRFTFVIPVSLGSTPDESMANSAPDKNSAGQVLSVQGNDKIYLGFEYKDIHGQTQWVTQTVELISDAFFDTMDRRFQGNIQSVHVGETVYLRLIDKTRDTSDERDNVAIELTTKSGKKIAGTLSETFAHSGVFKGKIELSYAGAPTAAGEAEATPVANSSDMTLPVAYGDKVTLSYLGSDGKPAAERVIEIYQGADGKVQSFTKQFKDPAVAVQTQFAIAEAYFEQAKRHRDLGQESLARREIAQGRKLLEEAIRDYPNTDLRPQAEYLLGNLSAEFAKDAVNEQIKKQHQADALARFTQLVATYPENPYAPKAQYKKALILEQMGQIDQAMEEYVKLSYRYPSNELVAETIARLGQYFMTKGKELEDQSNIVEDKLEVAKLKLQAKQNYTVSAQVFGRLGVRFPDHALAGKTTVLGAQCYIRAQDYNRAIEIFVKVVDEGKLEKDLIAQSMYWAGDCYTKINNLQGAYRMFKRLTLDYPESQWARYARGRLTEEAMVKFEEDDKAK